MYEAKLRKSRGAVVLFSLPNALLHPRLGLAVSGRVGNAVRRNRWKRLTREAFRLSQFKLPVSGTGHYDLVVSIRCGPESKPPPLPTLVATLVELAADADREWRRRARRMEQA